MKYLFVAALVGVAGWSYAQVIYQTDFEAPTFSVGDVAGQGGWSSGSDPDIEVSTNRASSGSQSLLVNTDSATWPSGSGWAWTDFSYDPTTATNKILVTSARLFVESGANVGNAFRAYGFDAYDLDLNRVAAARLRSDTGQIQLLVGNTVVATSATSYARNTWLDFALRLDFVTNTARVSVNGVDAGISTAITAATITDVDVYGVESVPTGGQSAGVANFDDYRVEAVPEPGTMAALGLGALALIRRRRAKKA